MTYQQEPNKKTFFLLTLFFVLTSFLSMRSFKKVDLNHIKINGSEVLTKQDIINNSSLKILYKPERQINSVKRRFADIKKARDLLGFEPKINLKDGLKDLSNWYNSKFSK